MRSRTCTERASDPRVAAPSPVASAPPDGGADHRAADDGSDRRAAEAAGRGPRGRAPAAGREREQRAMQAMAVRVRILGLLIGAASVATTRDAEIAPIAGGCAAGVNWPDRREAGDAADLPALRRARPARVRLSRVGDAAGAAGGRCRGRGVARLPEPPRQSRGAEPRALAACRRLPRLAAGGARHGDARGAARSGWRGRRRGEAAGDGRADRPRADARRCASTGGGSPRIPATRLPRRCSRTGVSLVGRSFKYHRPRGVLAARIGGAERAGDRRRRGSGGAERHGDGAGGLRRPGGDEPEPLAVARARRGGGERRSRAAPRRGLLLQDLHVAGGLLGAGLRAADPARGRSRGAAGRAGAGRSREGLRLLRPAGDRRRAGRADGGAGRRARRARG